MVAVCCLQVSGTRSCSCTCMGDWNFHGRELVVVANVMDIVCIILYVYCAPAVNLHNFEIAKLCNYCTKHRTICKFIPYPWSNDNCTAFANRTK